MAYVLGAVGLIVAVGSLAAQIAALTTGHTWLGVGFTLGVVVGAVVYRSGYRWYQE